MGAALETGALEADVRRRLFQAPDPSAPFRLGMEAEVIPLDADSGRPCPIEPSPVEPGVRPSGPVLRAWARRRGWSETKSAAGAPAFRDPRGRLLSFEPGGQIEYSSPTAADAGSLLADVRAVLEPLAGEALDAGIRLLARGMDPDTPVAATALRVDADRYRRMSAHYDRHGPAGRRMMRQTAALHLNLDLGAHPRERWWVANALVPALIALFANSPRAEGRASGFRSTRAQQWRELDPARTGVQGREEDPEAAYLAFALDAPAFLLGPEDGLARSFRSWAASGADTADWRTHLTTLFPEVRPRGYLELRCLDALPLRWYGAPLALCTGVLWNEPTLRESLEALPAADAHILERAGRHGLADPEVAARAALALDLALTGLRRMGDDGWPGGADLLQEFRDRFTACGMDPGHDAAEDLLD